MSVRVQIRIEIPGDDEMSVTLQPNHYRMADNPADIANRELDRAVSDVKAWLAARGASVGRAE